MVVLGPDTVAREHASNLLGRASRPRVDDRGRSVEASAALHQRSQPVVGVRDAQHVVAQVRADHGGVDDLGTAAECGRDVLRRLGSRRRSHAEERRLAELGERTADEEVVGAEVVAPHAHAVHLVDHDQPDADRPRRLEESRLAQPLRCDVDEPLLARPDARESRGRLLPGERRVDEGRGRRDAGRKLVHLILHERDERRENERRLGPEHRGELVRERLAGPGGHERERVPAVDRSAHDLLLTGSERVESEELAKRGGQVVQAREYREAARCRARPGRRRALRVARSWRSGRALVTVRRWIRARVCGGVRADAPGSRPRGDGGRRCACSAPSCRDPHAPASPARSEGPHRPRASVSRRSGEGDEDVRALARDRRGRPACAG